MNNKLVSVIIPVFNSEKYIEESIESVLGQTYKNIELICIDDGSTDNSLSILESFGDKIVLIKSSNCGASEARNKGISLAEGEYIAFLDADDVWEINKIELQMKQFEIDPSLDISFTHVQCFISPELGEEIRRLRYCPPEPIPGHIPSSVVMKRKSFDNVGFFDPRFKNGQFVEWLVKAKEIRLRIETLKDVLVRRRIHNTNIGIRERETSGNDYLKIIRESLNRRKEK